MLHILFASAVSNSCEDGRIYVKNSTSGDGTGSQLVEMCSEGVWSPVCDYNWTVADATVVCRELGYKDSGNKIYKKQTSVYTHIYNNFKVHIRII